MIELDVFDTIEMPYSCLAPGITIGLPSGRKWAVSFVEGLPTVAPMQKLIVLHCSMFGLRRH